MILTMDILDLFLVKLIKEVLLSLLKDFVLILQQVVH